MKRFTSSSHLFFAKILAHRFWRSWPDFKYISFFVIVISTLGALSFSSPTFAAYRVYQYVVRSSENPAVPWAYLDTSTLPPLAYQAYHGSNLIEVELLRSWPCPGDTSHQAICVAPGDTQLNGPALSSSPGSSYEN